MFEVLSLPFMLIMMLGLSAVIGFAWWYLKAPSRRVEQMLREIEAGKLDSLPQRTDFELGLFFVNDGFEVRSLKAKASPVIHVSWQAVTEVNACKRDLFTTDLVCVILTLEDGRFVEIHEEMKAFAEWCDRLPEFLLGAVSFDAWYLDITTPAFETCWTRLYLRPSGASPNAGAPSPC